MSLKIGDIVQLNAEIDEVKGDRENIDEVHTIYQLKIVNNEYYVYVSVPALFLKGLKKVEVEAEK